MLILDSFEKYNFSDPAVLTIGTFDGVHLGHQKIFHSMKTYGKNHKKVVITFDFSPKQSLIEYKRIIPLEERLTFFEKNLIDIAIVIDFSSVSDLSYLEFLIRLKQKINFSFLILGKKATFGKNREGTEANVKKQEKLFGFQSIYISKLKKNSLEISSTNIKELIKKGKISLASRMLGRPFEIFSIKEEIQKDDLLLTIKKKDIQLPPDGPYRFQIDDQEIFFDGRIKNSQIEIGLNNKIDLNIKFPKKIKIFNLD
jgi:riboflavin kinase / FMN adenylyltransferase